MIDFIDGEVAYVTVDSVVVQTGGIGYRVYCPHPYDFGQPGDTARVFTHQHVREDFIGLYGFHSEMERALFRKLLDVSGIGPKGALGIIASGHPAEVVRAVADEDIRFLTKLPGIGKKTAQRIILDLKDKLDLDQWLEGDMIPLSDAFDTDTHPAWDGVTGEAVEALIQLGYQESEAKRAVAQVENSSEEALPLDRFIKEALKLFMK